MATANSQPTPESRHVEAQSVFEFLYNVFIKVRYFLNDPDNITTQIHMPC